MGLHVEEWDGYVSLRRSAPTGRRVQATQTKWADQHTTPTGRRGRAARAVWAAAAIVLAKELKTFYSQEFSLEFDFNFI